MRRLEPVQGSTEDAPDESEYLPERRNVTDPILTWTKLVELETLIDSSND